jgi:hypothetical protein
MKDAAKFGVGRDLTPPSPYVKIEEVGSWGMGFDLGEIIYQVSDMSYLREYILASNERLILKLGLAVVGLPRK